MSMFMHMRSLPVSGMLAGAVLLAGAGLTGSASAAVVYRDTFSNSQALAGSQPDVTVGSNAWSVVGPALADNGGVLPSSYQGTWDTNPSNGYATLPVNGASGVTLDGSQSFTISATVRNLSNNYAGIMFRGAAGTFTMTVGAGNTGGLNFGVPGDSDYTHLYNMSGVTQPVQLTLSYDASTDLLTAMLNGQPMPYSYSHGPANLQGVASVNAATIAGITGVGVVFHQYAWTTDAYDSDAGKGATIDDFVLDIVPEPATIGLLMIGGAMLVTRRRPAHRG